MHVFLFVLFVPTILCASMTVQADIVIIILKEAKF